MKFQPDRIEGVNVITGHASGRITVNATAWHSSVIVPWEGDVQPWTDATPSSLNADHFARLVPIQPELVIFGSGPSLRFPPAVLIRSLIDARIGVETMDTAAACRTYNILAGEGRRVVAALLLD